MDASNDLSQKDQQAIGKYPICDDLRTKTTLLNQYRTKDTETEWRYLDIGCQRPNLCLSCGEHYTRIRTKKLISIMDAVRFISKQCHIMHAVFTIPHNHEIFLAPEQLTYTKMFHVVSETIQSLWHDSAAILGLHNWSSSDPEVKHLHIHALIICMNSKREIFHAFRDTALVRSTFQKILQCTEMPVVHLSYHSISATKEIYHLCRYLVRSPIIDYCRDMMEPLTARYIARVALLHRVHRLRYIGWLSNRNRHSITCPICLIEIPQDDSEKWHTTHAIHVLYDKEHKVYHAPDGSTIHPDEITHLDSADYHFEYLIASTEPP